VIRIFWAILVLTLVVGCQRAPAQTTNPAATPATAPAQAPSTGAPASSIQAPAPKPFPATLPDVLARVNGEPIEKDEFERALKSVEARAGQAVPSDKRDEVCRGLLDELVSYHVLMQESKARKIEVSDTDVDARIAEVRKQFPSEDDFNKALASRSMSLDTLKQEARQEMTLSRLIESEVKKEIKVEETDIKDFYDKNPDRFQQPESVRASHILIRNESNATDTQKKEARAKAEEVLKEVKAGSDFAALAKQHSQDGSAPQGGDLNFFGRGQMVPPFEQAAFALKPGETSEVVETQFGFHIIKVTDRRPPRAVPLAEVAPRIGQFLTMQQQQQKTAEFINRLKARSKIEILI
jgi:peptidyl-prolyl cis-trans isomerase C